MRTRVLGWKLLGRCNEADPALFHGPEDETPKAQARREAKAVKVCAACPVAALCLQWALEANQKHGVLGALGENDRAAARRRWLRERAEKRRAEQEIAA